MSAAPEEFVGLLSHLGLIVPGDATKRWVVIQAMKTQEETEEKDDPQKEKFSFVTLYRLPGSDQRVPDPPALKEGESVGGESHPHPIQEQRPA